MGNVLICVYCESACCGCVSACGAVFLEPDCKDSTVGVCSWSNIKRTGSPPRPKSGANGDMYVREVLPHASSHLLPGLCEQNGMLRGTPKPGPLLSVGPRSPALTVSGTTQVIYTLTRAAAPASPLWELHTHCFSRVSVLGKAARP